MQPESPLPPSSSTFTPPPGFEPSNGSRPKKGILKWVLLGAGIFLGILILLVAALALAPDSKDKKDQNTNNSGQNNQQGNAEPDNGDCTDTLRQFSNGDLGLRFCYPQGWGDVSVLDARFAATDAGSRYRLTFSKQPAVNLGVQSENWATTVPRDGNCIDPASPLPSFTDFSTSWKTEKAGDEVTYAMRGIEVLANEYLVTEEASSPPDNVVCLRGYEVINARAYKHVSASYSVEFNGDVQTPQKHIDNPNVLLPRQERTDFAAFVKSVEAL
jgi:hypothetical protein